MYVVKIERIINTECIREAVGVAQIKDKVIENQLRWNGCVQQRSEEAPLRRTLVYIECCKKWRGRFKVTWMEIEDRCGKTWNDIKRCF